MYTEVLDIITKQYVYVLNKDKHINEVLNQKQTIYIIIVCVLIWKHSYKCTCKFVELKFHV